MFSKVLGTLTAKVSW
uniref:Uncharacterized protein n=1 Tax=Rhizophora mucronata TaxID=61149 RepID=A0A2P2QME0_RHIMU